MNPSIIIVKRFAKEIRFFSTLVGEEGPKILGVKDSRVCF
jgi:hypothetical protein